MAKLSTYDALNPASLPTNPNLFGFHDSGNFNMPLGEILIETGTPPTTPGLDFEVAIPADFTNYRFVLTGFDRTLVLHMSDDDGATYYDASGDYLQMWSGVSTTNDVVDASFFDSWEDASAVTNVWAYDTCEVFLYPVTVGNRRPFVSAHVPWALDLGADRKMGIDHVVTSLLPSAGLINKVKFDTGGTAFTQGTYHLFATPLG